MRIRPKQERSPDYIARKSNLRSPILNQLLDTLLGEHEFNSICHETNSEHPRYQTIDQHELVLAAPVIAQCQFFYTDRLSEGVLDAMRTAREAGAVVYFEPSAIEEDGLFLQAG